MANKFNLNSCESELLESLVKVAIGGEYTDTIQKATMSPDGEQSKEVENTTRQIPPNPEVAQYLLTIIDESKYTRDRNKKRETDIRVWESGIPS